MEFDRAQLKRSVKLSMKSTASRPMLVTLLFVVVVSAGTWLLNTVLGGVLTGNLGNWSTMILAYTQAGYELDEAVEQAMLTLLSMGPGAIFGVAVGGSVLSILVSLWQSVMNVGYEGWCLSMVRNENPPMGRIFGALSQFVPVFITRFLTGVFVFLWGLLVAVGYVVLFTVAFALAALTESAAVAIPLILVAVVYLVLGVIWVSVRYALVDYVLLDKGLSGMEALRENKRLMKGNTGRVFLLQLSFIGWYLLMFAVIYAGIMLALIPLIMQASAYSTGGLIAASGFALVIIAVVVIAATVLMLWLRPYITGSMAKFYDWTQGRDDSAGHGPGFGGGSGGWSEHTDYTWSSGAGSGTGLGSGSGNGGPKPNPPKPRDDPWN